MAKIKYFISILAFFSVAFCLSSKKILAVEFSDKYQTYLDKYATFRTDNSAYVVARSQYLTFDTLNAKNQALIATKSLMISRNNVLDAYIKMLLTLNADPTLSTYWSDQEQYLSDLNQKIPAITSLDDSLTVSGLIEGKQVEYQVYAKKTVGLISLNKIESQASKFTDLMKNANQLVTEIRNKQKDVTLLETWLLDAQNKQWLMQSKIDQARADLANLNSDSLDTLNTDFTAIQYVIFESQQYLNDGLKYLNEFSENIKYGNY
jgi:hypothetical protein